MRNYENTRNITQKDRLRRLANVRKASQLRNNGMFSIEFDSIQYLYRSRLPRNKATLDQGFPPLMSNNTLQQGFGGEQNAAIDKSSDRSP